MTLILQPLYLMQAYSPHDISIAIILKFVKSFLNKNTILLCMVFFDIESLLAKIVRIYTFS